MISIGNLIMYERHKKIFKCYSTCLKYKYFIKYMNTVNLN